MNRLENVYGIDKDAFRTSLRENILTNAHRVQPVPQGLILDLVVKQAAITAMELNEHVKLFGTPERTIFCLREPESYMASAVKKFPDTKPEQLRATYNRMFVEYDTIGRDVPSYGEHLNIETILKFLSPLPLRGHIEDFAYKGSTRDNLVSD